MKNIVFGVIVLSFVAAAASTSFAHDNRERKQVRVYERHGPPAVISFVWRFGGYEPVRIVERERVVYKKHKPWKRWKHWKRHKRHYRERDDYSRWRHERRRDRWDRRWDRW